MKHFVYSLTIGLMLLSLASCRSTKDVAYFQNINSVNLAASKGLYTARIMPKDELTITVNATDPATASVFNLSVTRSLSNTNTTMTTQQALLTYMVENDGTINYPQLGKIYVVGMSCEELQKYICGKISSYFAEDDPPIVTVRMSNYRVTVLGEVAAPKVVSVGSEKMSVLEALASAGDLSIYGKRNNVLVIREDENGEKTSHVLNLNDASVINDPYYYVQQNDVIYVTPNKTKARNSDIGQATTLGVSITSILISLASLLYNILK